MTSTFSSPSSSMPDNRREHHDDPQEIRADIDQTRAAVGEKIDQLQARLDPNRLKQQAQETVQEMLTDTANSVTEYVRTHRDEMLTSVADAARRNPLPTALVGLGVGWLILESMAGSKRHDDEYTYERRNFSRSRRGYSGYAGDMGRSRGEFYEGGSGRVSGASMPGGVGRSRGEYIDDSVFDEEYNSYRPATSNLAADYPGGQDYGNGKHHGNPLAKAADAVKGTVSDVAGEIKDRVSDVTSEIKDRVSDVGHEIKDRVEGTGEGIKGRVEGTGHELRDRMGGMRDRMGNMVDDGRGRMGEMSNEAQYRMQKAGYRMEEWQQRARYEGQRRGEQIVRNLEDNPLIYGAVALAAGAALAMLLPSTRTESRLMGEMRDEVMDRGREVLETAKSHAQEVVSEIRPELEEKARQVVSDAKEMGKEIVKDAAAEMRPVVDKAVAKTKEEAKNVAQEAGINTEKLGSSSGSSSSGSGSVGASSIGTPTSSTTMGTGSATTTAGKTVVNRDTLRGQWTQLKGEVKSRWGQLTDDELTRVEGDTEKLIGALQTRYGYARGRAEQEVNDWFNSRKA